MRIATLRLFVLLLLAVLPATPTRPRRRTNTMNVKKLTPVLFVEEVEPCVKFWVERMGFQKIAEVPDGNKLGFRHAAKRQCRTDVPELRQRRQRRRPRSLKWSAKDPPFSMSRSTASTRPSPPSKARKSLCPCAKPSTAPRKSVSKIRRTLHHLCRVRSHSPTMKFTPRAFALTEMSKKKGAR